MSSTDSYNITIIIRRDTDYLNTGMASFKHDSLDIAAIADSASMLECLDEATINLAARVAVPVWAAGDHIEVRHGLTWLTYTCLEDSKEWGQLAECYFETTASQIDAYVGDLLPHKILTMAEVGTAWGKGLVRVVIKDGLYVGPKR